MIYTEYHHLLICDECDEILLDFDTPVCREFVQEVLREGRRRGWVVFNNEQAWCPRCQTGLEKSNV